MHNFRLHNTLKWVIILISLLFSEIPQATNVIGTEKGSSLPIITTLPEIDCGPGYYLDDWYDCQPCSPCCHSYPQYEEDCQEQKYKCAKASCDIVTLVTVVDSGSCKPNPCKNGGKCVTKETSGILEFSCDCSTLLHTGEICEDFSWLVGLPIIIIAGLVIFIVPPLIYCKQKKKNSPPRSFSGENPKSSTWCEKQSIQQQEDPEPGLATEPETQPQHSSSIQQSSHQDLPETLKQGVSKYQFIDPVYNNTPEQEAQYTPSDQHNSTSTHQNVYQSEKVQPGFDTDEPSRRPSTEEIRVNIPGILVNLDGCEDPRKPLLDLNE